MPRGRPTRSQIRQNIVEILAVMKQGYGYEIYKAYKAIFGDATQRSIYYHLNKGVKLEEFKVERISQEQGNFSWGTTVQKIYYALGSGAKPTGSDAVKEFFEKNK